MAKRKMAGVQITHLKTRIGVIQGSVRLAFAFFCVAVGFVVVATAFPQQRELAKLEEKLELTKKREEAVLADRENHRIEYRALREDPAFLELHARDRLDYYREGERVLRLGRER